MDTARRWRWAVDAAVACVHYIIAITDIWASLHQRRVPVYGSHQRSLPEDRSAVYGELHTTTLSDETASRAGNSESEVASWMREMDPE